MKPPKARAKAMIPDQVRLEQENVVAVGRSWLGTPYRHQARVKAAGVDCVGLCIGVGLESGLLPPLAPELWEAFKNYSRTPNPAHMGRGLETFMVKTDNPAPGDWAWIQWQTGGGQELPMHLAMLAPGPRIIHAYEGPRKVVEHGFVSGWPEHVVSWWRYPVMDALVKSYD